MTAVTSAPPAPPTAGLRRRDSNLHPLIAATAGAFAGLVTYDRSASILVAGAAFGVTFVGAVVALVVLELGLRLLGLLLKFAVPAVLLILVGCALHWPWAEHAAAGLRATATRAIHLGEHGLEWWRSH